MKRLTYLLDGNFLPNIGNNCYQQMENSFIIYKSDFLRRNTKVMQTKNMSLWIL